jgi:hypothetical protein
VLRPSLEVIFCAKVLVTSRFSVRRRTPETTSSHDSRQTLIEV